MRLVALLAPGLLLGLAPLTSPGARAATLLVPDDFSTIAAALAAAGPGDEIRVSEAGSPYREQIDLVDDVIVSGGWNTDFTSQDASRTVIELPADSTGSVVGTGSVGASVLFSHFTIRGGNTTSGGGIFCGAGSALTISSCVIRENHASATGGGVQIASGSSARIVDCRIEANTASRRGGGVAVAPGADGAAIVHCTIRACSTTVAAFDGGGGGVFTASGIRLERNTVDLNRSARNGGGLFVRDADIRAWGNLFTENEAAFHGGGIYHEGGDGLHDGTLVERCRAGLNAGGGNGAGVCFLGGTNRFHSGFVRDNELVNGDGILTGLGGGLYFELTELGAAVRWTEIVRNEAPVGGGIGIQGTIPRAFSFTTIESSSIVGNASPAGTDAGGGVHVRGQFVGSMVNNIVAFTKSGFGIACSGVDASPTIRFNCVYNGPANPAPEYGLNCQDRTGVNGNIRANPLFCCSPSCDDPGPAAPDLQLSSDSPCLGAGESGEDLGAHAGSSNCLTPIAIEETSWGDIKARYR